jgi:hypothetical protein
VFGDDSSLRKKKVLSKSKAISDVHELFNKEDLAGEVVKIDKVSKDYEVKFT